MLTRVKPQPPIGLRTSASLKELDAPLMNRESIFFRAPKYLEPLLGTELWQILFDLNQFTAFVSYYRFHQKEFGPDKSSFFEYWNAALEDRLRSYLPGKHQTHMCDNNFKEALGVAAELWISTGLWTFPLSTSLVSSIVGHLVDILVKSDLSFWRERFPDILSWILVIGGCCTSAAGPSRAFLLGHLQFFALVRRFTGKADLVKVMRNFIYMDGAYASTLPGLWDDVAAEGLR